MASQFELRRDQEAGGKPPAIGVDEVVQAQVALRLVSELIEELISSGVLGENAAARIATIAAGRTWQGQHSRREEIAAAILRLMPG